MVKARWQRACCIVAYCTGTVLAPSAVAGLVAQGHEVAPLPKPQRPLSVGGTTLFIGRRVRLFQQRVGHDEYRKLGGFTRGRGEAVAELVQERGITKGGSYRAALPACRIKARGSYRGPASYIGFRAAFTLSYPSRKPH